MINDAFVENNDLLWNQARQSIQKELSEQSFSTWIEPLKIVKRVDATIFLEVPNQFHASWLKEHYHDLITSSFSLLIGEKQTVAYETSALPLKEPAPVIAPPPTEMISSLPQDAPPIEKKDVSLREAKYTFDTFVVGSSCRFAHAAALAVSEAPAKKYNPLFIYGQVGLGKTHLLQAICHKAQEVNPSIKTLYISSEKFTNMLIDAIQKRSTIQFRQKFRNVDILLIDDIHFIAGKEATQEEFFHTFNDLYDTQKQIILTSDRPPKDIPGLEERLVSRFEWGLVTDIQPPDFETRVAILQKKMERETVKVPMDVSYYIANHIKSNIRELEGALIRVVAYASLIGKEIDLDLAKNVLKTTFSEEEKKITIDSIQQKTADYFNIKLSDMRTKKRNKSIAYPRQVAMFLVRSLTEHSLPEIGEYFGGRDHTTVLHAITKIEKECAGDYKTKKMVDDIITLIKR